jgi:hypothetical protein
MIEPLIFSSSQGKKRRHPTRLAGPVRVAVVSIYFSLLQKLGPAPGCYYYEMDMTGDVL